MKTKLNKFKKVLFILIPLAILALVILKLRSNKEISKDKIYRYDPEAVISVQVDTIKLKNIVDDNSFTGTFEPNKETKISAEVQGKISTMLVDIGSYVRKGQALIRLDHSLLNLQLQTVEVQIEGLEDDVERYTALTQANAVQGIQLEKANLGLRSAKVQRATLLEQINKTTIKAPFNGIVTAKLNEEGGFAAPGIPLLQITDITNLKFTINVPEHTLNTFQLNQHYSISAEAYPNLILSGKVIMIGSKADMGNSFPIHFQVANTNNLDIKSGMFGKISSKRMETEKGIVIPSASIIEENGSKKVYLAKNGKAIFQNITVEKIMGNHALISHGLEEGDLVITSGFINLSENKNIFIK